METPKYEDCPNFAKKIFQIIYMFYNKIQKYIHLAGDENQEIYLTGPKVKFVCAVRKCTSLLGFWNQFNIPVAAIFDV